MKRDMDLVREILLFVEQPEGDPYNAWDANRTSVEDIVAGVNGGGAWSAGYKAEHVRLLVEAGLLGCGGIIDTATRARPGAVLLVPPFRLTWEGHEFLAVARDQRTWEGTLEKLGKKGIGGAVSVLRAVLAGVATKAGMAALGLE